VCVEGVPTLQTWVQTLAVVIAFISSVTGEGDTFALERGEKLRLREDKV